MIVPRFYSRDRRSLALKLVTALLLSLAAHLVLIFGVRGTLLTGATSAGPRVLEARLVTSKALPVPSPASDETAPATPAAEPVETRPASRQGKPVRTAALPPAPASESTPATLPLPFDPVFYTWREVDVTAKLQGDDSLPHPSAALAAGVNGQVTIEVWVDETGKVADVSVIQAEPPGYFEEATLAHYRAQRFTPAMKDGKPRRFRARFLVEFGNPPPIAAAPGK